MDSCETRGTGMLPPQLLGDLLWRPIVSSLAATKPGNSTFAASLLTFGRRARPYAAVSAASAGMRRGHHW